MGSKTRKKVHRRKRAGGSKRRPMKRIVKIKVHYGGALTDYLPAAENIPGYSYLPKKESIPGYNFYKGVKAGYDLISSVGNVYDNNEPNISTAPPLPPLPKGGHPVRKEDIYHNKKIQDSISDPYLNSKGMLEQLNSAKSKNTNINTDNVSASKIWGTLRKYKPVTSIDKFLHEVGLRNKVREKLNKSTIGKLLVHGADTAKKFGFGKNYGGSKSRKRRVHRRGRELKVV
jgi:hypothetical protein